MTAFAAVLALLAAACSGADSSGGTSETAARTPGATPAADTSEDAAVLEEYLNAPPSPISATVTLDEAGAAEATIGPDGGFVEADGPGAHYRLDVSPGALADEVLIRIVPISDLTSPAISRFAGGVQFEPEGLVMIVPATLTITGIGASDDLAGYSYSGDGAEVTFAPVGVSGDSVEVTVFHFSGNLTGDPSPDAPPNRPTRPDARMTQLLGENLARTGECLDGDSNLPGFTTLTNYYRNWYQTDVGPMLEQGTTDDMTLGAAVDEFLRWYLLPIAWRQAGLLCDSEPYLEDFGIEFHTKAFELLSTGLVNGVDTAAKECASAHDLGEARNIVGWTAVAVSLVQAHGFPIEDPDLEYGLDKLFGCVRFKLVLNTTVRAEGGDASYGGTIKSEITDMVPTALAQLLGRDEGNKRGNSTAELDSQVVEGSEQCEVTPTIVADATHVPIIDPPIPEPRRNVPMPKGGVATGIAGFGPGRGGSAPGQAQGIVLLEALQTHESLEIVCPEVKRTVDTPGIVSGLFNGLHMDELGPLRTFEILLDQGSGEVLGTKTYDRTQELDGVPVTEKTTIELVHTPG